MLKKYQREVSPGLEKGTDPIGVAKGKGTVIHASCPFSAFNEVFI